MASSLLNSSQYTEKSLSGFNMITDRTARELL
ncbi:MAG: hypothetical protein RL020_694 [Pseudomonadota bacterium]|jgi:hypothetical protein